MIVIFRKDISEQQMKKAAELFGEYDVKVQFCTDMDAPMALLSGNTALIDIGRVRAMEAVDFAERISEPYIRVSRKAHPEDSVVKIGNLSIGGGSFQIFAGPCAIESERRLEYIARRVGKAGAGILRGGAYKPRTSPYSFQGLREDGLEILKTVRKNTGMPAVTEITAAEDIERYEDIDAFQVGARNMQNYELLKALGNTDKPVVLKRAAAGTLQDLLMSAEYIASSGNDKVILCERGIKTFETSMRNTLDLAAVAFLKKKTHLPVIVDPSHATGDASLAGAMAAAAVAAGADGIMMEVHDEPECALCDGMQSVTPDEFEKIAKRVLELREFVSRW